uniref:Zinc finger HIT domain-containing protein n=1 Tax=Timema bartmani TaxID=61472 RepID=A0A7R9HXM5_9NEOP|nr:unnamed protein product [Timema bartmani]
MGNRWLKECRNMASAFERLGRERQINERFQALGPGKVVCWKSHKSGSCQESPEENIAGMGSEEIAPPSYRYETEDTVPMHKLKLLVEKGVVLELLALTGPLKSGAPLDEPPRHVAGVGTCNFHVSQEVSETPVCMPPQDTNINLAGQAKYRMRSPCDGNRYKESEGLREVLKNANVRDMLVAIDNAPDPGKAIHAAMLEPIFVEFADECLKIVQPPVSAEH